jgi:hypothetical protein
MPTRGFMPLLAWLKISLVKPVQLMRIYSVAIHGNRPKNPQRFRA